MIQIFCGDDQILSRKNYSDCLSKFRSADYLLLDLNNELNGDNFNFEQKIGLFDKGTVYFGENIISRKEHKEKLRKISLTYPNLEIILWDITEARFLKQSWQNAKIVDAKLPTNVFKFLDALIPGNLSTINRMLNDLAQSSDENTIFFMVTKRIRELLLLDESNISSKLAAWQITKLKIQRQMWNSQKLLSFYDGLYRIEISNKNSESCYSLTESLSILLCLYI